MTLAQISLRRYSNPAELLADGNSFLTEAPYSNSYILGSLTGRQTELKYSAIIFDSNDAPILMAANLEATIVSLSQSSRCTKEVLELLVADMKEQKLEVTEVRGPVDITTSFSQTFSDKYGKEVSPKERFRIYKCTEVIPTDIPVNGVRRLAQADDLILVTQWLKEFFIDCELGCGIQSDSLAKSYIDSKSFQLWVNLVGEVVSMAATNRANEFSINVCFVYTPKEYRGNGYAYQLVKGMAQELLQTYPAVVLNAFTKNLTSQGVYKRIGFAMESEYTTYIFSR
ncbi:hypothetical protein K493DRAFT_388519 [Basidiobolus meristosporus CBS 931.73]|uniref:N-acetyltransferase domain-containing protein n=1 Tax=Basidiobolus meristosporus CBS 931.73 TaxID=1314790 RepID=A0A1Y1XAA3_9FUNG|nr:hypothetical protein K493DRAFT_388519 [Basidiobolus meristosporus CBS 931.73]|eukprot:ORX82675.1 hypothetical protein K493DRAFT_388519 [Basidiobolus meristosporus CBS 931.73]